MDTKNNFSKIFLLIILAFVLFGAYLVFKPFLLEILVSAILVSIFYTPYQKLVKITKGRKNLSALIMCLAVALLVIIPLANLLVFAVRQVPDAYNKVLEFSSNNGTVDSIIDGSFYDKVNFLNLDKNSVKSAILEIAKEVKDLIISSGTTSLIVNTTSFFVSLVLIIFTMFFFFVDGDKMLNRLMYWTPLPNKYDKAIFKKFRDVSHSTMIATFVTAIAQGLIGAIGFMVVGLPAFFAGIAMAFFSLIPYVGTAIVWLPFGIYLLVTGQIWQGVFLLIWGGAVVGWTDNLIRAYLIKDKAQVHPIFIIFSILGGIIAFGFWGVIFGPLIISLAVTILHIYEMEYSDVLEK